jgi:alpha-L-fucosidase
MRIGLVDVDGRNFPNLALMKLSAWHKAQGDAVEWWNGFTHYNRVYLSKVFTFTPDFDTVIDADEIITGGTGYKDYRELPPEVENTFPDYSIYPQYHRAVGFLTRGCVRQCEWCVVPGELCPYSEVQTGPGPLAEEGDLSYLYNTDSYVGSMPNILYSRGLAFTPAEIDTSIRPGWFWHQEEEPKSLKKLFQIYLSSVGGNACLNLNIPPNRDGLLDQRDVARLKELRELLDQELGHPLEAVVEKKDTSRPTQPEYVVTLASPVSRIKYVELREDIAAGQRVETFRIEAVSASGGQFPLFQGTTIGNRRICALTDPFADQNRLLDDSGDKIDRLVVKITAARGEVSLKSIAVM